MNVRMLLISMALFLCLCRIIPAQEPDGEDAPIPTEVNSGSDQLRLQFTAAPLSEVIELYQELTSKRIIRDPQTETAVVTIETNGTLSRNEAIEFIDKSLLLAGYAFVPSGNMLKIIAFEGGKVPSSEGVPMILRKELLPDTDQIVSFLLPFKHLEAEKAAQAFNQIIPTHAYGKIVAIPNAKALIITENSNTIRSFIELAEQVDVPPSEVKHRTIQLERADAEEVAQQLSELLGIGKNNVAKTPSSNTQLSPVAAHPQDEAISPASEISSTITGATPIATEPKIQALARTNSLLIVARPLDIEYIESLVVEYDAATPQKSFTSRKLHYMDVMDFAAIATDALLRSTNGKSHNNTAYSNPNSSNRNPSSSSNPSFTSNGSGSDHFNSLGGGSNVSSTLQEQQQAHTQSMLIGKTLLIVDPPSGQFFASGPPEQLRVLNELADELDRRPKQIMLSAIIGEMTLGDDFNFGLDWIRTLDSVGKSNLLGGVLNTQGTAFADISKMTGVENYLPAMGGLTVYGQIGKHMNVFLQALEGSNRFHVLQKPTVTTLNHKKAEISIGQSLAIPGQSLTVGNGGIDGASVATTTQYIEAVLQLNIVPHIYANNEVRLDFEQINKDISGYTTIGGNQVPNLSTQTLRNTIIIPNGSTVLLGGLITDRDTSNKKGLPFMVRVPILKHIFGNTSKRKERRELMIFIQPHILDSNEDHLDKQQDWGQKTQFYRSNPEITDAIDQEASLLPPPQWNEKEPRSGSKARNRKKDK